MRPQVVWLRGQAPDSDAPAYVEADMWKVIRLIRLGWAGDTKTRRWQDPKTERWYSLARADRIARRRELPRRIREWISTLESAP